MRDAFNTELMANFQEMTVRRRVCYIYYSSCLMYLRSAHPIYMDQICKLGNLSNESTVHSSGDTTSYHVTTVNLSYTCKKLKSRVRPSSKRCQTC